MTPAQIQQSIEDMAPWVMEQMSKGLSFEAAIPAAFQVGHEFMSSKVGDAEFANQAAQTINLQKL